MKQKKKNRAFTFLCSFFPGAAEMYMGFMRMGVSLMVIFVCCFTMAASAMSTGFFVGASVLVWLFGFFHARNMAHLDEEDFQAAKDCFIWEELLDGEGFRLSEKKGRKFFGIVLILCGVALLWGYVRTIILWLVPNELWEYLYPLVNEIPSIIIAAAAVAIGIRLILGKKEELDGEEDTNA